MEGKNQKKKQNAFFCCGSSGNRKKQMKETIKICNTKEEPNSSKNSMTGEKFSPASSSDAIQNDENLGNVKFNQIPKISTKENSIVSNKSNIQNKIDKNTMPIIESLNRSNAEVEKKINKTPNPVGIKLNLSKKFAQVAAVNDFYPENDSNKQNIIFVEEDLSIPNEEHPTKRLCELKEFNSSHKDKFSVKEGVDFTFKRSMVDTRSEIPLYPIKSQNTGNKDCEINEYINNRENFKQSVATVYNNTISKGNIYKETEIKFENENFSQMIELVKTANINSVHKNILINEVIKKNSKNSKEPVDYNLIAIPSFQSCPTQNIIEENPGYEEFVIEEHNEGFSGNCSDSHSVISSQILSHINTPKMITGIKSSTDQSLRLSVYSKSEVSNLITESNILVTENNTLSANLPSQADDTEFEITNENSDRFNKFIETPKSTNLFFTNSRNFNSNQTSNNTSIVNPHVKDLNDKLHRKEREAKKINEKIQKIVGDLQKLEEENKLYERRVEKEDAEGEMLRHMLNFLLSNA